MGYTRCGRAGQRELGHVTRTTYLAPLMKRIVEGEIDPSFLITHTVKLEDGPEAYKTFRDKKDGCIKVVLKPY